MHQIGIAHRAAGRRGRSDLVAGDGLSGCGHGGVGELVAASQMMPAMRAGVKARAAHGVLRMGRGVPEHARDKFARAQAQRLALAIAMVRVVEAYAAPAGLQQSVIGQRPTAGVTRQVQRNPAAMGVGRRDLEASERPCCNTPRAIPFFRSVKTPEFMVTCLPGCDGLMHGWCFSGGVRWNHAKASGSAAVARALSATSRRCRPTAARR